MKTGDLAVQYHSQGLNCAQCILRACSGFDEKTALAVGKGLGAGMRCGEMCGCVSGAIISFGIKNADSGAYKRFINDFSKEFGCLRCADLKANIISCDTLIEFSADAVVRILGET